LPFAWLRTLDSTEDFQTLSSVLIQFLPSLEIKKFAYKYFSDKIGQFFFIKGRLLKNNTKYKKSQNNQKERKIYIRDKIGQIMNNFFLFFNSVLLFPFPFSLFSFQFHFSFRFSFLDIFFTIIQVAFKLVNGSC
jgi:hypothetical protein